MDPPARAGRYRLDSPLGEGAYARVWLGRDEQLDVLVAVKILEPGWARRNGVRERFLQEARLLRQAESQHIVQVFDIGELPGGRPYFVMTYANGGTLQDRLRAGPLALEEVVRAAHEIAAGLTDLHAMGVVHRDVKPSNVLIRSTERTGERLLLSDLGIAKQYAGPTAALGTHGYAAPEQMLITDAIDARTDVYGLGALVYHLLCGQLPASGAASPLPSSTRGDLPAGLDAVVIRAMSPDPASRWPSAGAFAEAVSAASGARTGRRGAVLVASATVVALSVAGAVALSRASPPVTTTTHPASSAPITPTALAMVATTSVRHRHARWLNPASDIPEEYLDLIVKAGTHCELEGLSPAFIAALLKAESGFDPDLHQPAQDEYGIARWTPRVLHHWQPGGLNEPMPEPPLSPELSIPPLGGFFCGLGPQIAELPGDPVENLAGLYRTSVLTMRENRGVPPQWAEHAALVRHYLADYTPR